MVLYRALIKPVGRSYSVDVIINNRGVVLSSTEC